MVCMAGKSATRATFLIHVLKTVRDWKHFINCHQGFSTSLSTSAFYSSHSISNRKANSSSFVMMAPIDISDNEKLSVVDLVKKFNYFVFGGESGQVSSSSLPSSSSTFTHSSKMKKTVPFIVDGYRIGIIIPDVLKILQNYPDIFIIEEDAIKLSSALNTSESRSDAIAKILDELRAKDAFPTLRGWRNELFECQTDLDKPSLFRMERSATCLFGIREFGVHINGFVRHREKGLSIWMQKRSDKKHRWPGMWDNMVGGGLTAGFSVEEVAAKEAEEEAGVPQSLLKGLQPRRKVSIMFENYEGVFAATDYVYDLELPEDFIPKNMDGEVEEFWLVPVEEAKRIVLSTKYKTTSAPIALDFLIRHEIITKQDEPQLEAVKSWLCVPFEEYYTKIDNFINVPIRN